MRAEITQAIEAAANDVVERFLLSGKWRAEDMRKGAAEVITRHLGPVIALRHQWVADASRANQFCKFCFLSRTREIESTLCAGKPSLGDPA